MQVRGQPRGTREGLSPDEKAKEEEDPKIMEQWTRHLLRSFESFSDESAARYCEVVLKTSPSFLKDTFEDLYLRDMLKKIPKMH